MTLKEYRTANKLTVRKLTEELKTVDPRFTMAMVSNMENGEVEPPEGGHHKDNPIDRGDLKFWTGLTDRVMRKAIEGLRNRGYWILNDGYGYYITFNKDDLEPWINKERARARSINRTVQAMLSRVSGQTEMGKD